MSWLELAGRRIILPLLELHEEAVGHAISVTHHRPALPGSSVVATATLTAHDGNRVVCRVKAHTDDGQLIADGEFTQVILPLSVIVRMFDGPASDRTG